MKCKKSLTSVFSRLDSPKVNMNGIKYRLKGIKSSYFKKYIGLAISISLVRYYNAPLSTIAFL